MHNPALPKVCEQQLFGLAVKITTGGGSSDYHLGFKVSEGSFLTIFGQGGGSGEGGGVGLSDYYYNTICGSYHKTICIL